MPCCTLLMNARAGRFRFQAGPELMQKLLQRMELDVEVLGTKSEAEMVEALRRLVREGADRVAVAGGDGTIHLAAQILAKTDTALGIVPQGTMNNVATALRLPLDIPSALRVLQTGNVQAMDLGYACRQYFLESAGVGMFANALAIYGGKSNKNLWRGIQAVVRIVGNLRASRLTLTIDGVRREEPSVFAVAANTYRIAQALPVAPGASVLDGKLDLLVLGDLSRRDLLQYYIAIRQQVHLALDKAELYQAKEIRIESRRALPVHVDDKVRGATPVTIQVVPHALKVLVERL